MLKFFRAAIEDDDLLDHELFGDQPRSLNRERMKLGYWVRFVCVLALLIASTGLVFFTYIFGLELGFGRNIPYKVGIFAGGLLWLIALVFSVKKALKGSFYARVTTLVLLILAAGLGYFYYAYVNQYGWFLNDGFRYSRMSHMRLFELVLLIGFSSAGLLAFPAAYFGWQYAQSLRIPQVEENDWAWKTKTAKIGLKAWRLGALSFIALGIALGPVIVEELERYYRRYNSNYPVYTPKLEVEEAIEMPEEDMLIEEFPPSEVEDNAPEID